MKNELLDRWNILKACFVFTFQKDTAYWADNWASVLSTTFYTISMLIFIHVLYANVKTIVGYDRNEMLFFLLIGQLTYYSSWAISTQNMQEFIQDVNRGDLDLILTKPIPALFYITFKRIRLFSTIIRDGIPPTLAIILVINWQSLHLSSIGIAVCLFIFGQICLHVFQFLTSVPVIWLGESTNIAKLGWDIEHFAGRFIPLEGFPHFMRMIFGVFIPVMIATAFTTSVLLGKSDPWFLFIWAFLTAIGAIMIRSFVWGKALKSYTSASS